MPIYQQFIFESYVLDLNTKRLDLHYGFDDTVHFTEHFSFNFDLSNQIDHPALDRACFGLFMMAGISYYKAVLPPEIVIKQGSLTRAQADFFDKVYRHGLGEFYTRNQLTVPDRIDFPFDETHQPSSDEVAGLTGALVPMGGGKDSLVTVELLNAADIPYTTWTVGHSDLLQPLIKRLEHPHFPVERQIAPQLLKLNQEGAYNGHVPISAILAFTGVISALLSGRQDVVLSNEASAGEGNLDYQGLAVNHQYSKTLEFERDFQEYVRHNITTSVRYFSLLRSLSELRIAELFCTRWLDTYAGVFSSCNRNFKLGSHRALSWCGECPKCAFVFLIFAPFVTRDKLIGLFGKNLFAEEALVATYLELLGIQGHKPFECVGEIKECRQVVVLARASGEWPELDQYDFPEFAYDWRAHRPAAMPDEYQKVLEAFLP